ncbi:MAG: threonine/serine exporter family protein [Corynebacterium sp.]|nr:threonine/serine exporter family protein [Corynebacterium sp.]
MGYRDRGQDYELTPEEKHEMELQVDTVIRLGLQFMAAGTSGYRVVRGMKRAARSMGFDRLDVVVSVNALQCTFYKGTETRTILATHEPPGVDASRIEAYDNLTHNLPARITHDELTERLDHIETYVRRRWSKPVVCVAAGLACFGFALLNRFSLPEAIMALIAACLGQWVRATLAHRHLNHMAVAGVAGMVSALFYYGELHVLAALGHDISTLGGGFIAAVLFLVPGFPMYSAMLDLARFDITAGSTRLIYALSLITTATISVSVVTWVTNLNPEVVQNMPLYWWEIIIASCLGIGGFSILFNSSRRMILVAMVVGSIGNLVRINLVSHDFRPQYAALIGGLTIGLLAGLLKKYARLPRITITVPAAVIMVPGTSMYRAMYYLNEGQMDKMLDNCTNAAVIVICISAGLSIARMLTDRDWTFGNPIDFHRYRPEKLNNNQ